MEQLQPVSHDGLVTLRAQENRPVFANCYSGIALTDGRRFTTHGISPEVHQTENGLIFRYAGTGTRPEIELYHTTDGQSVTLQLGVTNTTDEPLAIDRMLILAVPEGFMGTPIEEIKHSQTGYQAQGRIHRPRHIADQEFISYTDRTPECQIGPMQHKEEADTASIAPWMTRIVTPDGQLALTGFLTAHKYNGFFSFHQAASGHTFAAINDIEGKTLHRGNEYTSEPVLFMTGTVAEEHTMLLHYRDRVAAVNAAVPQKKNIKGWASWYREYPTEPNITEAIIEQNAEAVVDIKDELQLVYFQVDDGFQKEIGDWDTNEKFPGGHRQITQIAGERGLSAGIWIVPFAASDQSKVFQEHRDWFIKDDNGDPKPVKYHGGWQRWLYALDPTHPDASTWQTEKFRELRKEEYDFVKIDFAYLAGVKGNIFDEERTSVERMRMSMKQTIDAFEGAVVLGCQLPFLPSVGLVHANRTGHDIKPIWNEGNPGNHSSLEHAVMATQESWWMNVEPDTGKGLWQNDPDCIIVRGHNSDLTFAETQTWLTTVLLANGALILSDDLTELEPERLNMIKHIFKLQEELDGLTARPMGPYTESGLSELMLMPRANAKGITYGALFNWGKAERELTFDPQCWGADEETTVIVTDQWTGEAWITNEPFILPPTPSHGTRLLAIQKIVEDL